MTNWPQPLVIPTELVDTTEAMERTCERLRMLFAEAGYPHAGVSYQWTGIFVDNVPRDVMERAFDLINGRLLPASESAAAPVTQSADAENEPGTFGPSDGAE